jgi:hypothetical protein
MMLEVLIIFMVACMFIVGWWLGGWLREALDEWKKDHPDLDPKDWR